MKRGKFSLSHTKLLSCDMGELVPLGLTEVLPGDTFQHNTTCMIRFSPLLAPVMHPVHASISHWFVPHRLVWEDWEDFITGGPDGNNDSEFPTITYSDPGGAVGDLGDFLGVPPLTFPLTVSALPFRAYSLIFNEWYRDQDLQTPLVIDLTSGPDTTTNRTLQRTNWEKDYFTTARPWEQKGPQITIPLGDTAPVSGIGTINGGYPGTPGTGIRTTSPGVDPPGGNWQVNTSSTQWFMAEDPNRAGWPGVFADLSGASAITINLLREAFALQRFEEARARFGSRYVEYLRYLGVRSSDARLQRPEFLGGGRYPVQFSEVLQTAEGTNPVGELRGHGIGVARSNRYRRFFEEHGYVITLLSVKPKTIYGQGVARTFNRRTKEDFFQRELQHIGQQEVQNIEVYADHTDPSGVFGYQDRYDEYRRHESTIAGEFRSTLDFWHFARQFSSDPALNASFVVCSPSEEPFAVPANDVLYVMAKHSLQARRLVSQSGQSFIY